MWRKSLFDVLSEKEGYVTANVPLANFLRPEFIDMHVKKGTSNVVFYGLNMALFSWRER